MTGSEKINSQPAHNSLRESSDQLDVKVSLASGVCLISIRNRDSLSSVIHDSNVHM